MPPGRTPVTEDQRARARAVQACLKARREELGMGLEELARAAGINRRTLDKYFQGDSASPSFFLVVSIAGALGVPLDDLAGLGAVDGT
jgi:transcriptional regulator with XRE-family HTH domain